jgi:hypothetical protein
MEIRNPISFFFRQRELAHLLVGGRDHQVADRRLVELAFVVVEGALPFERQRTGVDRLVCRGGVGAFSKRRGVDAA